MRIPSILVSVAVAFVATPVAAQTFQPAVVSTKLPPLEALWHMRVALNVAALGCRGPEEGMIVASYNALIRNRASALNAATNAIDARYKAQYGGGWMNARERDMTKLYNYFAQPTAQVEFCAAAKATLAQVASIDPRDLPDFALASLPALESPFWSGGNANAYASNSVGPSVAISAVVPVSPGLPRR